MNKQELKNFVTNCFPSVFTKDDVFKIIDMLNDNNNNNFDDDFINELSEHIKNELSGNVNNIIDIDNIELSIGYRKQIEIDSISLNEYDLKEITKDAIKDFINWKKD